jgi:hypothetical protein
MRVEPVTANPWKSKRVTAFDNLRVTIGQTPNAEVRDNSFKEEKNAGSFPQARYGSPYRPEH